MFVGLNFLSISVSEIGNLFFFKNDCGASKRRRAGTG
jgi:hypothetical protein